MNKQNRFFRHKGLAGALAMVAVILAVAFAAGYHLPDAAAKKGKETAALTETQKQMPQKAPEPAISPEKAKEADLKFAESRGVKTQKAAPKKDKFNYEQRNWDFDELERLKREELRRNLEE